MLIFYTLKVAIKAGQLLAQRLYGESDIKVN